VNGAYASYVAGFETSFSGVTIFIPLKEHPLLNLIFQIGEVRLLSFYIGPFHFILFEDADDMDVCRYRVRLEDLTVFITFTGIDSQVPCGSCSNVGFVHFIWTFKDMLVFRRHALKFLPGLTIGHTPRLLCLRHYMVASMGWAFVSGCVPCRDRFRNRLRQSLKLSGT
jgi:hypothetical protein